MLTRCFKTLFSIRSINRDFQTQEAQFTAVDVSGYEGASKNNGES